MCRREKTKGRNRTFLKRTEFYCRNNNKLKLNHGGSRTKTSDLFLYKTLVQPKLEYAATIRDSGTAYLID